MLYIHGILHLALARRLLNTAILVLHLNHTPYHITKKCVWLLLQKNAIFLGLNYFSVIFPMAGPVSELNDRKFITIILYIRIYIFLVIITYATYTFDICI